MSVPAQRLPVLKFLRNNGSKLMNVDGSTTPVEFSIAPPSNEVWYIARLLFYIRDTGAFDSGNFGNGIVMTNGIQLETTIAGEMIDILDGAPIFSNTHLSRLAFDTNYETYGQGDNSLTCRFSFNRFMQDELVLTDADSIIARIRDDLTTLVDFDIMAEGWRALP